MAKESMKAREVKRAKLCAKYAAKRAALKKIVATGTPEEDQEDISVSSVYHVSSSVRWLLPDLFRVLRRQAGNNQNYFFIIC